MNEIKNIALISAAGSGKTHALTKRFLFLYLHRNEYPLKSLYAITFTNAAAYEMKSRILRYLDVLSTNSVQKEQEEDILETFKKIIPQDELSEIAQKKRGYLINNLSELNVSTFHSLFASFLSTIPFTAGILPDYRIVDEQEERIILEEVIDNFFELSLGRGESLNEFISVIEEKKNVKEVVEELYNSLIPWIPYLHHLNKEKIENCLEARKNNFLLSLQDLLRYIHNNISASYTKEGTIDRNFQKFFGKIEETVKKPVNENIYELMDFFFEKMEKDYIKKFISRLQDGNIFRELVKRIKIDLKECAKIISDKEILSHLKFIIELHKCFQERKLNDNILTFNDIEFYIQQAFAKNPEMEYLYFKLGAGINHLMIDEFQDTSFGQLEILEPIIEEITSVASEEKSLFYVGDPFQTIFRWRQGTSGLFDYMKEKYKGKIVEEPLDINYRTKVEIIAFVNKVLDKNDRAKEGNTGGWVRVEDLGKFDYVEDGREAIKQRVLNIIKELKAKGYKERDIAILTRRNDFAAENASLLSENGIPCFSRSRACVENEPDFQFILHCLNFLENPEDDFSLLHILTSEVVELKEEVIRGLLGKKKTLYFALADYYPNWKITKILQELLRRAYFSNPYEILFEICHKFNLKISYPIATIFDTALLYLENGYSSLSAFLDYLKSFGSAIEIKDVQSEGVNIMTIHKAKGLEFDVVIIPETHWELKSAEHPQLLFSYAADNVRPQGIYWRKWTKYFEDLLEKEKERMRRDALHLLYVALTRAKDGVWILSFRNKYDKSGFWIEVIKDKLGGDLPCDEIPVKKSIPEGEKRESFYSMKEEYFTLKEERDIYSPTERGIEIIEPARRKGMRFGDIVHKALGKIGWLDNLDIYGVVDDVVRYIKANYPLTFNEMEEVDKRLKPLLIEILNDPDLKFIFYKEDKAKEYRNEMEIYFDDGKNDVAVQIDRIIIEPEVITIIDYKTGMEKFEYKHQLEVYKKGIELIYKKSAQICIIYLENPQGRRKILG